MRIIRYPLSATHTIRPSALTIGNFDGVHLGHAAILADLLHHARICNLVPTVMTFEPHPKAFFAAQQGAALPNKILPLRNKLTLLAAHGIEQVVILPFDTQLASMHATDFVEKLLLDTLSMKHLLIGDDFRFGNKRLGDFSLLQSMSSSHGFSLNAHASVVLNSERISSSTIRSALNKGDLHKAEQLLGHPLILSGHVIYGQQLGRTIGCPTINIKMPHNLATRGIYAVSVQLQERIHQGVASIGVRPSVNTNEQCWLEVHIFDFNQDVYGQQVDVTLLCKIRDEEKFADLSSLTAAITRDITDVRAFFASQPSA